MTKKQQTSVKQAMDKLRELEEAMAALRGEVIARAQGAEKRATQAQDVARQAVNLARGTGDVTAAARAVSNGNRPSATEVTGPIKTYVGDEGSTSELHEAVRAMLRERPMYQRDVVDATGARAARVNGVLIRLSESGEAVNVGKANKALWWIPDPEVLRRITR